MSALSWVQKKLADCKEQIRLKKLVLGDALLSAEGFEVVQQQISTLRSKKTALRNKIAFLESADAKETQDDDWEEEECCDQCCSNYSGVIPFFVVGAVILSFMFMTVVYIQISSHDSLGRQMKEIHDNLLDTYKMPPKDAPIATSASNSDEGPSMDVLLSIGTVLFFAGLIIGTMIPPRLPHADDAKNGDLTKTALIYQAALQRYLSKFDVTVRPKKQADGTSFDAGMSELVTALGKCYQQQPKNVQNEIESLLAKLSQVFSSDEHVVAFLKAQNIHTVKDESSKAQSGTETYVKPESVDPLDGMPTNLADIRIASANIPRAQNDAKMQDILRQMMPTVSIDSPAPAPSSSSLCFQTQILPVQGK